MGSGSEGSYVINEQGAGTRGGGFWRSIERDQSSFQDLVGHPAAADRDKRPATARVGFLVDEARDIFETSASFSDDENGRIEALANLARQREHTREGTRF